MYVYRCLSAEGEEKIVSMERGTLTISVTDTPVLMCRFWGVRGEGGIAPTKVAHYKNTSGSYSVEVHY